MAQLWLVNLSCFAIALLVPAAVGTQRREACDCNGRSRQCMFDPELHTQTGNGYRCLNCMDNTEGANCEKCKEGFYRQQHHGDHCLPCNCNPTGSISKQCDNYRRCHCKPGVMGDKCDRCQHGFHSFSEAGCIASGQSLTSQCDCDPAGSTGQCISGRCVCKGAVAGHRCDSCKPGYYNLEAQNLEGCAPCFCYGHSATCSSSDNYSVHEITSTFQQGDEGWQAEINRHPVQLQWSSNHRNIHVASRWRDPIYFVAPAKFLGNQQLSYGQKLSFSYRVNRPRRQPSQLDVILEGANLRVSAPLLPLGTILPCNANKTYAFRLDEQLSSSWSPRLTSLQYRRLLGNLTALLIRATYGDSTGYLDNVVLVSARPVSGTPAPWVEQCVCPVGYQGQSCEKCAPGYKREDFTGLGAFSSCVLCNCRGGGSCDPDTGECYSGDEDRGDVGTICSLGFYSAPWTSHSCQPCPCPGGWGCSVLPGTLQVVCDNCPPGTGGPRCEFCTDGYFGDHLGENGPPRPCQPCQCGNDDPNAIEICNRLTGECQCKEGFFRNPLSANPTEKCKVCNCNSVGSESPQCRADGSCICKPGFEGPSCEQTRCPTCYSRVRAQVDQYLQQLQGLEVLLTQVQPGGDRGDTVEVETKMRQVENMLQQVLREAQSLQASDRSLGSRLSKVKGQEFSYRSRLDEINETAKRLQSLGSEYQSQVQTARRLIERARLDLEQSKTKVEGMVISSTNLPGGSNHFLILAQEAMQLANSHMRLATTIEQAARAAVEASKQAEVIVQAAVSSGGNISPTSVQGLRKRRNLHGTKKPGGKALQLEAHKSVASWHIYRYDELKLLSGELETDAGRAALNADRAYQDSQLLLGSLARLPKVDPSIIQEEASQLQQKANSLTNLGEIHMTEYKRLQSNIGNWEEEIQELLQKGQSNRMVSFQLLSRANLAKSSAQQALSASNTTFDEVEGILKNLKEFDLQVDDKQKEAKAAMQRLPLISNMVASANDKIRHTEEAIGTTSTEAEAARRMAGEAKEIVGTIDQEIGRLTLDANRTADGVLAVERGIMSLRREARDVEGELQRKLLEIDMDTTSAQEAVQMSQEAKVGAEHAGSAVQDVLSALENVLLLLEQPGTEDEQGVNLLEMNLRKARDRNNQLKELMLQLEKTTSQQNLRVQTLETSITEILADIKNLKEIRDNLPQKCYNIPPIEEA